MAPSAKVPSAKVPALMERPAFRPRPADASIGDPSHADARLAGPQTANVPHGDSLRAVGGGSHPGPLSGPSDECSFVAFGSVLRPLWVCFLGTPRIDPAARRLTIMVPSLDAVIEELDEVRYDYRRLRGLGFTDVRLDLLDPAGNRLHIRQRWSLV